MNQCFRIIFRQKLLNPTLDLEDIRLSISSIALAHPNVAITVLNESTGKRLLQIQKSAGVAFKYFFCF
jgi:hypothetical protein